MSLKAQTPREPTLPSRAPTTLLQAEAEGRHARPRPRLGERGNTAGPARRPNSHQPAWPLFISLSQIINISSRSSQPPGRDLTDARRLRWYDFCGDVKGFFVF